MEKEMIEIKTFNGEVIFTLDAESLRKADLHGANLYRADLRGTNLYRADLRGTNLSRANLSGANLRGANLSRADLYRADLRGANLYGANLYEANLYGADLSGANLRGANLYEATLYNVRGILALCGMKWPILISHNIMKIGCQTHTHNEWKSFSDKEISKMHVKALEFWSKNKDVLITLCENLTNENLSV